MRKFHATSVQASAEVSRWRQLRCEPSEWWTWPASASSACLRASSSWRVLTKARSMIAIRPIISTPPTYSPTANSQPIRIVSTSPSSHTRFVEANWKASAETADAPRANSERAIAIAAYEHEEEAAPSPVAFATGTKPSPDSAASIRSRGTQAWIAPEIAKPSTSAHQTSQAISPALASPSSSLSSTSPIPPEDDKPAPVSRAGLRSQVSALLQAERGVLVGDEDVHVGDHSVRPPEHALDELEQAVRVAAGEEDR